MPECVIIPEPDRLWEYCPSYSAAIGFLVIYSASTFSHLVQGILHRKPFTVVLIVGGAWELTGFVLRVLSVQNPHSGGLYSNMGILVLLAPLWINAFVYMALGRLLHFSLRHDTVLRLRARHLTIMFVVFDVTAFIMQASGGIMAAKSGSGQTKKTGYDIYSAGVGIQMGFILWFVALVIRFHYKLQRPDNFPLFDESRNVLPSIKRMIYVLYFVLVLILYRNSYRLAEYATGANSPLRLQEWWFYVFDAVPMAGAMVLLNIFHPGKLLQGPQGDFSAEKKSRKVARREKKTRKERGDSGFSGYESLPLTDR